MPTLHDPAIRERRDARHSPGARPWLAPCLLTLLAVGAAGQSPTLPPSVEGDGRGHRPADVSVDLTGHWSGAFIHEGSAQAFTLTIEAADDGWLGTATVPEWPWAVFAPQPVTPRDDGGYAVELPYDAAVLRLDPERQELLGTIDQGRRVLRVHLKRMPSPPPPRSSLEAAAFDGPAGRLCGTVVRPTASGPGPFPTLVWISGRGCWSGSSDGPILRARALAEHGVASVVFDKRGTGGSEGDCGSATLDDLVADVHAIMAFARGLPGVDDRRLGLAGSSAGGWVAIRAAARAADRNLEPPAFLVTLVGPATSVEVQQRDNARLIARDLGLPPEELSRVDRYLDLMFDGSAPPAEAFAEMTALLEHARATGWIDYHDDTDIPTGPDGLDDLWVRRHRYDPADDLRAWERPYLALLGGRDRVVPARSNAALYEQLFAASGNTRATVRILPDANHGLWLPEAALDVGGGITGFGFSRPSPDVLEQVLVFLRREGLLGESPR